MDGLKGWCFEIGHDFLIKNEIFEVLVFGD